MLGGGGRGAAGGGGGGVLGGGVLWGGGGAIRRSVRAMAMAESRNTTWMMVCHINTLMS